MGSAGGGPTGFMVRALIRVRNLVSRICCWLLISVYWFLRAPTLFLYSLLSPDYLTTSVLSMFWVWSDGNGTLGHLPAGLGSQVFTLFLLFPMGEVAGQGESLLVWAVLPWERGDMGKMKLFFLSSSVLLFFDVFVPRGYWNLSVVLPGFHKGILIIVIVKIGISLGVWHMELPISSSHWCPEEIILYFSRSQISSDIS